MVTTLKGGDVVLHARTTLVLYYREGASVAQLDKHSTQVGIVRCCPGLHELIVTGVVKLKFELGCAMAQQT